MGQEWTCFVIERTGNVDTKESRSWCEQCQEEHVDSTTRTEYRRLDTNETYWITWTGEHPIGAMYFSEMVDTHRDEAGNVTAEYKGNGDWNNDDGLHLIVQVPGYKEKDSDAYQTSYRWDVDARCNNCGSPQDRMHRCWVRHGQAPHITVDKNGPTCTAGAGSILVDRWHGFLREGKLITC